MILSVSRRTDIPAFYSDWFLNRVRAGFVYVRNPMNAHQVSRIEISPAVVDCIVFWTKNPAPLVPRLGELAGYDFYFQYTVNAYGREVEPHLPALEQRLRTFASLSAALGKERVIWRYDPILFSDAYTPDVHLERFEAIAARLRGKTERCVISLVDIYPAKNGAGLARLGVRPLQEDAFAPFFTRLAQIAKKNGMEITSCAETVALEPYGIRHGSCIDRALIERITGSVLRVRQDGQRPACLCARCEEIGAYDTCAHGCLYCYANFRNQAVEEKCARYDPRSPLLCDTLGPHDRVTVRPVRSLKQTESEQTTFL